MQCHTNLAVHNVEAVDNDSVVESVEAVEMLGANGILQEPICEGWQSIGMWSSIQVITARGLRVDSAIYPKNPYTVRRAIFEFR